MRKPALIIVSIVSLAAFLISPSTTSAGWFDNFWWFAIPTAPAAPTPPPTPTYSPKPSPTLTPKPTSTPKPSPTATPRPSTTSTPRPSPTLTVDKKAYLMNAINNYRTSQGLSQVQTDPYTCGFAKVRAGEISQNFNHDGFRQRIDSHTLPYPSYHYVNENIAMNADYRNVVNGWINSPTHAANMRADTPFVCVEYSGNYYAYEGWRP